ncbi:MAG: HDOD domain-containing protein [Phycisphaerae bacterium]|nr:HDOD domain-containing protein [Phycisphaerae bacterium]
MPSPKGVAFEILRLTSDERTTLPQLASIVKRDPATTARLLKFVNSPFAGVARRITSVSQAVVLLGMETVKSITLAFSLVSQLRQGPCAEFDYEAFWSECVARAVAGRRVAHQLKRFNPDEVFTCGLLCQLGRLAFATAYPGSYSYVLEQADADVPGSLLALEHQMFELDHNELAAEMMEDWHLPPVFCEAVRLQDSAGGVEGVFDSPAGELSRVLHLTGVLSALLTNPQVHRETLASVNVEAARLDIMPDVLAEVFDLIAKEWCEMGAIFDVKTRNVPSLGELYPRTAL